MKNPKILAPKEFADNVFGPEDERKAKCIHCGAIWYEVHYKDGVCNSCQERKLPGQSILIRRAMWKNRLITYVIVIITLLFTSLILS